MYDLIYLPEQEDMSKFPLVSVPQYLVVCGWFYTDMFFIFLHMAYVHVIIVCLPGSGVTFFCSLGRHAM
jgi:hypothetical protein